MFLDVSIAKNEQKKGKNSNILTFYFQCGT